MNAMKKVRWMHLAVIVMFCFLAAGSIPVFADTASVKTVLEGRENTVTLYNGQTANETEDDVAYYMPGDHGTVMLDMYNDAWDGSAPDENDETGTDGSETTSVSFTSSDPQVVSVDEKGQYRVLAGGKALIRAVVKNASDEVVFDGGYWFYSVNDMSKADLAVSSQQFYLINGNPAEKTIAIKNAPDLTRVIFDNERKSGTGSAECELDKEKKVIRITMISAGSAVLTVQVNNCTYTIHVTGKKVTIKSNSALLVKKKKTTLKIKGYSGKLKWKTFNKKIATVTQKGVVKGVKCGNTVVYTEVDGQRIGCAVSVVTAKRKKVIQAAKRIAKGTYSQPKRMLKGYYDCSSLVWRAYKNEKKYFGDKSYAPVAADIARWCFGRNKRLKGGLNNKNLQSMKPTAGSLIFLTGAKNGRYKGIYHVEMFVGYYCGGFDSKGKPILGSLWAARPADRYINVPMAKL